MEAKMWNSSWWVNETDPEHLKQKYNKMLLDGGFCICGFIEKYFDPFGYTALWLLSESHLAVHTFPEENKTYVELSSCVKKQFEEFSKQFKQRLNNDAKT